MIRREKYLKTASRRGSIVAKRDQKINANQRIEALKAEKDRILAELASLSGGQQNFALAA